MAKSARKSYSITLPAGTQVELKTIVNLRQGYGTFYKHGKVLLGGTEKELLRGFAVEHDAVGKLELPEGKTKKGTSVLYKQLENEENSIYYYSDNGEIVVIDIIIIPIHDHSSLVQGGPAFGTYHSDYDEEQ